jgi:LysR family cys regulon transcriptional activator
MKLQQLRYIVEVYKQNLNISNTAEALFTSQPGISKQVRQLEQELGVTIFKRHGKLLTELTPAGQQIIAVAADILDKAQQIKNLAEDYRENRLGSFRLGTTHNQARYVLPEILKTFMARYPNITLHVHQGTPMQIAEELVAGKVDLAIATEALDLFESLVVLPCYEWHRCLLVPHDHLLAAIQQPTLEELAAFPIVTYVSGFSGRSQMDRAFEAAKLAPNVVLTAVDADVIKTYVRLGLGVGVVATMAYDPRVDKDLVAIDARELFGTSVTKVGMRRDLFFRQYMYDFIELFAPALTKEKVEKAVMVKTDDTD